MLLRDSHALTFASAEADTIDVADHLGVEIPEMRLGEFVLEQFGRIPKVGETVRFSELELIIEEGTARMIQAVRIKKCEPSSETDSDKEE